MPTIHIVSHTHWDREWYRPFQNFRLRLVHLVDGLLDLLEKDPQFKYFMLDGQTIVLEDYLEIRPEREALLRDYVRKGRIIIGPWHILPDMFLVSPESHIRNLLLGDRTSARFGPKMMIGYIPDPFGHPSQVPQILHGFGIETACLWRGLVDEPAEFWWESPDGTRVLMVYLRDSYSNGASLPADNPTAFTEALKSVSASLAANSAVPDYLIMYGTDHMEPPANTSKAIGYADRSIPDMQVVHSTLPKFVKALQSDIQKQKLALPTVTGELRACKRSHLLPGVLSTRIWIKQRNHASETLLLKWAEPFATWQRIVSAGSTVNAPAGDLDRKSEILEQAWRLLMQNHPHDSICGCSIDQVHEEMKSRFDQVDQIGEELVKQSLENVAAHVITQSPNAAMALLVFNPTCSPRKDTVDTVFELPAGINNFELLDEQGNKIPYQQRGMGNTEIVNMTMDAQGLQSTFGYIIDGRAAGMSIEAISIKREDSAVFIEAVLSEDAEPNLKAWKAGRKTVDDFLKDSSIKEYHVHARSADTTKIVFTSPEVPPLGYRTIWVHPRATEEKAPIRLNPLIRLLLPLAKLPLFGNLLTRKKRSRPPYRIENEFFVVDLEKAGTLALLDKRSGKHYSGMNAFQDGGDCGDEYNYAPPTVDHLVLPRLKRVNHARGPVQQSLEIQLEMRTPASLGPERMRRSKKQVTLPITTSVTLTQGVARVDIRTILNNQAKDHRLRAHFPAPFTSQVGYHDGHFEVVERKPGVPPYDDSWIEQPRPEVPQRAFTEISEADSGLMLANRGLPEVEVLKNPQGNSEIAITLIRAIGWLSRDDFSTRKGHAGPFLETPGAQMQGRWVFDYSIIPHADGWESAFRQAYAFETPLRAISTGIHPGTLPFAGSFVESSPQNFVVSAVKSCGQESGWLLRGYNIGAEPINVSLKPWKVFKKVALVNLAEKKLASLVPDKDGSLTLPVGAHAIVSILFKD